MTPLPQKPSICVVMATYNSGRTIERSLASVRSQRYPQDRIRIVVADGGSTDRTVEVAKKYGAEVIAVPADRQNAEYNKGVAVRASSGDLLLMIDHDNVLPHADWLKHMVRPFLENNQMVAVQTLRYSHDPTLSLLDRYLALLGASDPVVYALGKCDRLPWFASARIPFGTVTDKGRYYVVAMDPKRIPTLGANGCLVRRDILFQYASIDEENFFHIDVHVDLITQGFNTYAFTKDTILHLTSYRQLGSFLYRRKLFMDQFYLATAARRRYSMYRGLQDLPRLALFILAAATFVWPTLEALRGYMHVRDRAWFLHPVIAFCLLAIYAYAITRFWVSEKFSTLPPIR